MGKEDDTNSYKPNLTSLFYDLAQSPFGQACRQAADSIIHPFKPSTIEQNLKDPLTGKYIRHETAIMLLGNLATQKVEFTTLNGDSAKLAIKNTADTLNISLVYTKEGKSYGSHLLTQFAPNRKQICVDQLFLDNKSYSTENHREVYDVMLAIGEQAHAIANGRMPETLEGTPRFTDLGRLAAKLNPWSVWDSKALRQSDLKPSFI